MVDKGFMNAGEDEYFAGHNHLDSDEVRIFKNRARCRHETFNKRMKDFNIIAFPFRSPDPLEHKQAFYAVALIIQYQMENGNPIFSV